MNSVVSLVFTLHWTQSLDFLFS